MSARGEEGTPGTEMFHQETYKVKRIGARERVIGTCKEE